MAEHYVKYIKCGSLEIAATCETQSEKATNMYLPSTILCYVQVGEMHVNASNKSYCIKRGEFGLIGKYTEIEVYKTWTAKEGHAKMYGFALTNTIIQEIISQFQIPQDVKTPSLHVVTLPTSKKLEDLMTPIINHVEKNDDLDPNYVERKTIDALTALAEIDDHLLQFFKELSVNKLADLIKLMENNYLRHYSLQELAEQSGRSLSTFNRDFRTIFSETPHRWIMKKRAYHAHKLMKEDAIKPSQVYLESGFESLSHFSKVFKNQFNITPSEFYKQVHGN